jgi:hypothetical protein
MAGLRSRSSNDTGLGGVENERVRMPGLPDIGKDNDSTDFKRKMKLILMVILGISILVFIFFPEKPNFDKLLFTQTTDAAKNSFVLYFDCYKGEVIGLSVRDKKIYHIFGEISRMGNIKLVERDTSGTANYGEYVGEFDIDNNRIECNWIPPDVKKLKTVELMFSVEKEKTIENFLPQKVHIPSTTANKSKKKKKRGMFDWIFE